MTGQLGEHPLVELLHEISVADLSGALRLEHERLKTVVYLADGAIVYAASNLRRYRLAECLKRWQLLSEQQLSSLPADASDLDLAATLIDAKTLTREALEMAQARQVTEVLRAALLWTTGSWEFDARVRMSRDVRVSVNAKALMLEGARRLPTEFAVSRFPDPSEKLTPIEHAPDGLELLPTEGFILSRLDAPLSVGELVAISGLAETETRQIVYILTLGGLIKRERWPQPALSPETIERARALKTTTTTKVAAQPTAQTRAQPEVKKEEEAAIPVATVKEEADEELQLDELFARLAIADDHYQVLGVRRTAAAGEIKSSYHKLAKRFHPDRFHQDEELHARIEEAFARIAQAYETLKEKQSRAVYDLKLSQHGAPQIAGSGVQESDGAKRESVVDVATQENAALMRQAENSFQRGLLALKQGKPTAAISSFSEAARLAPREARYRAYHGRALAENESTWRQAEAEMKAAISFDSKNTSYYVMLAEFYLKIGLPRRAQSELERALALDSQNATARQLLASIQATLKGQR